MTFRLLPIGERVVVLPDAADTTTATGLIIPEQAQRRPALGVITAISRGCHLPDNTWLLGELAVGEHIVYGKYSGTEVELNGVTMVVIKESEVLGVLDADG